MTSSEPGTDRRKTPRVQRIQLVQVIRFDDEGFQADLATGRTVNISRDGVRVELRQALPLRSPVSVSIVLGDEIVEVAGNVVYLEAIDDDRTGVGIGFTEVSDGAREILHRQLAETASSPR